MLSVLIYIKVTPEAEIWDQNYQARFLQNPSMFSLYAITNPQTTIWNNQVKNFGWIILFGLILQIYSL